MSRSFRSPKGWKKIRNQTSSLGPDVALLGFDGHLRLVEPVTLRHRILHVAARIIHRSRQTFVRLDTDWPWTGQLLEAFRRIAALPAPAT